jgi:HlyD family secretion protein
MRRVLIILIILGLLGIAGIWIYQTYYAQTEDLAQIDREEHVIEPGTLSALVNATGTILPERQTTLAFKNPGRVEQVLVEEGQVVSEGQLLARLETTDLEYAVSQAELALAAAQAQYLRIQRPAAQHEVAAAEAALDSAQASYRRLRAGPLPEEIQVARTNLDQASATLAQAQAAYDRIADRPDVALLPQALQLEQATVAYEAAKASFDLTMRGPTEAELAGATSAIAQAEASLARLQEGASDEDLLVAQIQVQQAQLSVDQARHQLDGTELFAPHKGTITFVGIQQGELSGGQPAFVLTDLSQFHLDVLVDEIDIGPVAVGQQVNVTLDALSGTSLRGQVDRIGETAQFDAGIAAYNVTVQLEPTEAPLRVGMTANVDIVTERREDILLVPNRFVRIDRTTGQASVDRLVGQEIQTTEIQIGLRDETFSQVLAGLEDGDTVVLVRESSREQLRRAMEMGPP